MKRSVSALLLSAAVFAAGLFQAVAEEPFSAVKAIVGRLAGGYNGAAEAGKDAAKANAAMAQFTFVQDGAIAAGAGKVEAADGKIKITAADASGASFALGQYLRHTAKVHISWCGNRTIETYPLPTETVTYTPAIPVRFAYNYCTLSYTMAFWSANEWREEIDRLALSGYNVALVLQGLQEAWRVTLESVKNGSGARVFSDEQIMKYVSDEAAQAWWHMGNLEGLGGPLGGEKGAYSAPGAYEAFKARTAADAVLGEYIYAEMMKLGIQPSIQSFVGLVPDCSNQVLADGVAENGTRFGSAPNWGIINEGGWQGYTRPDVVNPLNIAFDEMSKYWYGALVDIYKPAQNGYTSYMGGDLFHEGGNKGSLTDANLADIAKKIQDTQAQYFGNGGANKVTWVLQSWQGSPYQGIRNGLDTSKAIIQLLDKDMSTTGGVGANYYAYKSTGTEHIPWIWVEVLNFGGNTGMHGGARRFRNLAKIGTDANHRASFMGYGILSEGLETNPMMYDMFNDAFTRAVGQTSSIDDTKINQWISDYCERRYGLVDDNLKTAYGILINTVFDCSRYQEGCVENMLCAGPDAAVSAVSKWGPKGGIEYDPAELYPAAYAFLDAAKAHPELLKLETFQYDFVELFLQLIGERGRLINGDITVPGAKRTLFLKLFDLAERLTASSDRWRLDWHEARTKTVCPGNEGVRGYRRMVTCWADGYAAGQATGLREYAHRAYAGLLKDYYLKRWLAWFDKLDGKITAAQYTAALSALDDSFMTAELEPTPKGDLVKLGEEILETLNPPALTLDAIEADVTWNTAKWIDAKGVETAWTDEFDVNLSGVCTISATSPVTAGAFTLAPSKVVDTAIYTGYLPQGAENAVKLFTNLNEEDRAKVAYFRGTMNGGWVAQGEAKSYQVNDGPEYCEMQMQRIDDGYLKSVRVRTYFNPVDNCIWGYAVNAGNINGGVIGANVTGTGTKVAMSDGAEGYGIKEFAAIMNSDVTLTGAIAINGLLTVTGGKLTLTTAAQAAAPSDIKVENGTLVLANVGETTLHNVVVGANGKIVISGGSEFTQRITVSGTKPAKGAIVFDNGEEELPLECGSDGVLKVALSAKTYAGEIAADTNLGWKNLTLDDLARCEFLSGATRATNILKGESAVTLTIGGATVTLTLEDGVVHAASTATITGLELNPAEAQLAATKTNYASIDGAIVAAGGAEIVLLADAELKNATKAALTLTVPAGITFKAEGNKLPWDQGNATYNVYGTIDFGSTYKEFGYNNQRHHALNLYAGSMVKGQDIVSFYTAFTLNVLANPAGGDTVTFEPTFRSCWDTTINIAEGVKLILKNNIIPRANSGQTGSAAPKVIKDGAGELILCGILADGVDAKPSITVTAGTLSRALEQEEIFTATVNGGTANITSADEDYEVVEPADPVGKVHTWKSQGILWLYLVTDPGETAQNGPGVKFKHFAEAYEYALQLRKNNPGQTVKLWGMVANETTVKAELAEVGPQMGLTLDVVIAPAGMEVIGWDEPVRYYYTAGVTTQKTWATTDKVTGYRGTEVVEEDHDIAAGDIIMFDKTKGNGYTDGKLGYLYIHPDIVCTEIDVVNETTIQLGFYGGKHNVPNGWTVNVGEGSQVLFNNDWADGKGVVVPQAQFNGKGTVSFGSRITSASEIVFGKVKGNATITIPSGLVVKQADADTNGPSFIENPLAGSGKVLVKNVDFAYTLVEDSSVTFEIDPSVEGSWAEVRSGNIVTFEPEKRRVWASDTVITQDSANPVDIFVGITLEEILNGTYTLGGTLAGSWLSKAMTVDAVGLSASIQDDGDGVKYIYAQFQVKDSWDGYNGLKFGTMKLIQQGVKIVGYQSGQGNIRNRDQIGQLITNGNTTADGSYSLKRIAAGMDYPVTDTQSWAALPGDVIPEDTIVLGDYAELTLTSALSLKVKGTGNLITTVEPSTDLKSSLQAAAWKGTFTFSGVNYGTSGTALWGFNPSNWGNEGSVVEIKDGKFFFMQNGSSSVPVKLTGTITSDNGWGGQTVTLDKVFGSATVTLNKSLVNGGHTINIADGSEFTGTIISADNNTIHFNFAVAKVNGTVYYTVNDAIAAAGETDTIEILRNEQGMVVTAAHSTQKIKVPSGFEKYGNFNLVTEEEGLWYKTADLSGDGTSILFFMPGNDTAFGKTWTNIYLGPTMQDTAEGSWMTGTDWATKSNKVLVRRADGKVPHTDNGAGFTPTLIDGNNLRHVITSGDGYKHIAAGTLVGWNTAIGVANGVALTIGGYTKMQGDNNEANYLYVDATSKLTLNGSPVKWEKEMNLHVAAEEGIVIGVARNDAKYNYYLEGVGSVAFTAASLAGTHVIKQVPAVDLGTGDYKTVLSRKLISCTPADGISISAAEGAITATDATVMTSQESVSDEDAVGAYALRKGADGIYLDVVARSATVRHLTWNYAKTYWESASGTDGNGNRGKAYKGETLVTIGETDVVDFPQSNTGCIYINKDLSPKMLVKSGATVTLGKSDLVSNIPSGAEIEIEENGVIKLSHWQANCAAVIKDAAISGAGKIVIDTTKCVSLELGKVTGGAMLEIPSGFTVTATDDCALLLAGAGTIKAQKLGSFTAVSAWAGTVDVSEVKADGVLVRAATRETDNGDGTKTVEVYERQAEVSFNERQDVYSFAAPQFTITDAAAGSTVTVTIKDDTGATVLTQDATVGADGSVEILVGSAEDPGKPGLDVGKEYTYEVVVGGQTFTDTFYTMNLANWFKADATSGADVVAGGSWATDTAPAVDTESKTYTLNSEAGHVFNVTEDKGASKLSYVEQTVTFTSAIEVSDLAGTDLGTNPTGAITIANDGVTDVWYAYIGGEWKALYDTADPQLNTAYTIRVDLDRAADPQTVSYVVNGRHLKDADEHTVWNLASGAALTKVIFKGEGKLAMVEGVVPSTAVATVNGVEYDDFDAAIKASGNPYGGEGAAAPSAVVLLTSVLWAPEAGTYSITKGTHDIKVVNEKVLAWNADGTVATVTVPVAPVEGLVISIAGNNKPIAIPGSWIDAVVKGGKTLKEIGDRLNTKPTDSDLTYWQLYTLGFTDKQAGTAKTTTVRGVQTADEGKLLICDNTHPVAASGIAVKRVLFQGASPDSLAQVAAEEDDVSGGINIDLTTLAKGATRYVKMGYVFAAADDATTATEAIAGSTTFGVLSVAAEKTEAILSVPWCAPGGESVTVADYLKTANLTAGDTLNLYDSEAKKFVTWTLQADGTWVGATRVAADGVAPAAEPTAGLPAGSALVLVRQTPAKPLYLFGQTGTVPTKTTVVAPAPQDEEESVYNLITPAIAADVNLNNIKMTGTPNANDIIRVDQLTTLVYKNGVWGRSVYDPVKHMSTFDTSCAVIKAGQGLVYISRGGSPTFVWVEGKEVSE